MGLDVFYCSLQPEPPANSREAILAILRRGATDTRDPCLAHYRDGGGEVWGINKPVINSLMFSHFRGRTYLSRMLEIADRFDGCLVWEGGEVCVTRAALLPLIPEEMRQDKELVVLRDVEHLDELLGGDRL